MREAASIARQGPSHPGLDFESLRRRGIEILQELSGEVWTDYNTHDPGVTILEALCYALTELSYRADLPIDALLRDPHAAADDGRHAALFAPSAILTSGPVTESDWRRLIIDRVAGVANVWLSAAARGGAGVQDITVYIADRATASEAARRAICRAVRRLYHRYRPLCEDLGAVRLLRPAPAMISGSLEVSADADPDAVLAEVFHRLQLFLAPEPRRRSPAEAAADSRPASAVFDGPLLRGDPIEDHQQRTRPTDVSIADLTAAIDDVAGVLAVNGLSLRTPFGTVAAENAASIHVPPMRILSLDTRNRHGDLALRLTVRGVERRPDAPLVEAELARRWAEYRRDTGAARAGGGDLGAPRGTMTVPAATAIDDATLRRYESVRAHFPLVYGIGPFGLPADAGPQRKAQARQFKGYLHTFEQLLANYFARLAAARDAFSTDGAARREAWQALPDPGGDAPLLPTDYSARLTAVARRHDRRLERRNRVFDLMLATYGESLGATWPSRAEEGAAGDSGVLREQIRAKRRLLRHLPWLGHRRACGRDYYRTDSSRRRRRSLSGLEVRSRIELGLPAVPGDLASRLQRAGVALVGSAPPAERAAMIRHAQHIEATFAPVPHIPWTATPDAPMTVSEELLIAASHPASFRIGQLPDDPVLTVVCRAPGQPVPQLVGRYTSGTAALTAIAALVRAARRLAPHVRRLTIVEHILLRFGATPQERLDLGVEFTATAVVALPGREAADPAVRQAIRRALHTHAPAHIVLDVVYLRLSEATAFETIHAAWRSALRQRGRPLLAASRELREFLAASRT